MLSVTVCHNHWLERSAGNLSNSIHSIPFHSIPFRSIQFNSIQFNSIQFNSIQFNSIQFNSIQFSLNGFDGTDCLSDALQVQYGAEGVTIECDDGSIQRCDAVIITVSVGVLKSCHATMFTPPLPDAKADAIRRIGFGVVDKVFVSCKPRPRSLWDTFVRKSTEPIDQVVDSVKSKSKSKAHRAGGFTFSVHRDYVDDPNCYGGIGPRVARHPGMCVFLWNCDPKDALELRVRPKVGEAACEEGGAEAAGGRAKSSGGPPAWVWSIGSLHREEPKDGRGNGYVGLMWICGERMMIVILVLNSAGQKQRCTWDDNAPRLTT